MARRYIGDAVIVITYHDDGDYRGTVSTGGYSWRFRDLHAPPFLDVPYDSSAAYDKMAASAVSFGSYYTSGNRGGDDTSDERLAADGYPDVDTADAISEATGCAQDDHGRYAVSRSLGGATRWVS